MATRMPIWGVGPTIMVPTFGYLVVAGIATYLWPAVCLIQAVPYVFLAAGVVLLAIGLPMLVVAAFSVNVAYKKDELATTGIFGVVRNPIYSAWIVFNIPGLVFLVRSWPMFFAPFLACCLFKMLVSNEEKYLEDRFGQAYLEYKARVPELFPWPRKGCKDAESE
ncbi:MAG: methyltransferase family protein [Thermoguttaceae bacterium]